MWAVVYRRESLGQSASIETEADVTGSQPQRLTPTGKTGSLEAKAKFINVDRYCISLNQTSFTCLRISPWPTSLSYTCWEVFQEQLKLPLFTQL